MNVWMLCVIGLAIIGAVQVVVLALQARRLRQTVDAIGRHEDLVFWSIAVAEKSADAAVEAAAAMKASVGKMDEVAQRQLRAYLGVRPSKHSSTISGLTGRFTFEMELWNHGQTPAYGVTGVAALTVLPSPLPEHFEFPPFSVATSIGAPTVGAQEQLTHEFVIEKSFFAEELAAAMDGSAKRLYFFGEVTYADVFDSGRRSTRFCMSAHEWPGFPLQIVWRPEAQHNYAT